MTEYSYKPAPHEEYEREDFRVGGIIAFLVGLGVLGLLIHFIVTGMYRYLEKYEADHQAKTPLVAATPDTRKVTETDLQKFPTPRLQRDDVDEMRGQLFDEERKLESYGWIDEKAGQARIPIERAMELTAERGLPQRQAASSAAPAAAVPAKRAAKVAAQ